jgi:hypothetical protein
LQVLDANGGNLVVPVTLAASGSIRELLDDAIYVPTGELYLSRGAGKSTVTVYYRTVV